ncbi:MAG TPA: HAEPLYID family protein [Saprospiraceae bacterium]|nr:HAEPLYID family protein [Saprospiraceae bacterium]HMO40265.1 HAEPLYID family protein [Saprospiraceae bacterium]HMP23292.1 HAEPLYID family protein [Saprospiraceae bacterium]
MKRLYKSLALLLFVMLAGWQADAQEHHHFDEEEGLPLKILHAEPLYIDLIRDLGARKGEREWNVGAALVDRKNYDSYEFLVEYEWAIIDRLGIELEVPVTLFSMPKTDEGENASAVRPSNRVESLKMAAQYTFLVSGKLQTSLAIGGIVEWELTDFDHISTRNAFEGVLFNPFFIAAKRWGPSWHSLIYTGPRITRHFYHSDWNYGYEINTNIHYMIPDSRNFIGVEFNKIFDGKDFSMVIRPQMRVTLSESTMIGIVPGIPVSRTNERLSAFVRLIYEPPHRRR